MYVITYKDDGAIMSVGSVPNELVKMPPLAGNLYMIDIPTPPDERPFRKTYKVRDSQLVYDPTPDEEPEEEEVTYT